MKKLHELIASLVYLAGGEMAGRVRLQKILYLLDFKGLDSGAGYFYHHYGPYSEDLWNAVSDAKFYEELEEITVMPEGWSTPYSVFKAEKPSSIPDSFGRLSRMEVEELLSKLKSVNSTVLELAATAHWLESVEKVPDWKDEIERRKSGKTKQGRLARAVKLLEELELEPATS